MKLGLHSRLLVSLLVLLLVVFILLGAVLLTDADDRINKFRETQARYQAKTLAEGSLDGLVAEDYELLERWVHSSMPSDEYAYAALIRPYGKVLTHTDLSLVGEQLTTITNIKDAILRRSMYQDRPVMEVVYPARIGKKVFANAHVAYYLDTESIFHRATLSRIIVVLLLSLLLLIVASHFITRTITIPIARLRKSVNRVSLDRTVEIDVEILGRQDEIGGLARSFQDVSETLVESHDELYRSMLENSAIVETSIDGIIVIDEKGIIESANTSVERIFGYAKEELIGANVSILMSSEYRESHNSYIQSYLQSKQSNVIGARREFPGRRKDGSSVPIELAVREIRLEGKSKFASTIRDITSRYENEQAMLMAKEAAEEGNRIKTEFLATISHELRTPLNGVIGSIELIKEESGLSEDVNVYLDMANKSAHNLLVVLNNILDFSDMQSDRIELKEVKFDIRELFSTTIEAYAQTVKQKSVSLSCQIDDDVPQWLIGDDSHIRGVLRNLLNNAIKFTEKGNVSIACQVIEDLHDKKKLRVEVVDTGIGIELKDQERIFDMFTQADGSHTRAYGGTGIGLSICKKIVKKMGGEIGVDSEPGRGSNFWFTLTLKTPQEEKVGVAPEPEELIEHKQDAEQNLTTRKNNRLLIVEDEVANQIIIKAITTRLGYVADVVGNGEEALDAVKQKDYGLILMDCMMPVMDGFAATQAIRQYEKDRKHTPIVAVTANAMIEDRDKCISVGMDDYLAKPINKVNLNEIISKWLVEAKNDDAE